VYSRWTFAGGVRRKPRKILVNSVRTVSCLAASSPPPARVHNHWSTTRSARATKPPIAAATARPTASGNNHPLTTWAARATRTSHALWHVRNEVGPDLIAVQDLDIRHLSARKGSQNRRASNFVGHQGLDL
jgi:hypothetical protein